jgi:hypothetical protein
MHEEQERAALTRYRFLMALLIERDDLIRAAMEKADFTYKPTAFAQALIDEICERIKAADDKASEGDYMLDSDDCISVIRGTWGLAAPEAGAGGQGDVSGEGGDCDCLLQRVRQERRPALAQPDRSRPYRAWHC